MVADFLTEDEPKKLKFKSNPKDFKEDYVNPFNKDSKKEEQNKSDSDSKNWNKKLSKMLNKRNWYQIKLI